MRDWMNSRPVLQICRYRRAAGLDLSRLKWRTLVATFFVSFFFFAAVAAAAAVDCVAI